MSGKSASSTLHLPFAHQWQAEILTARPMILPSRHFVYPAQAEEVERGALELLVHPSEEAQPFLATCALGFRDAAVPMGVWSCPNPNELCAVSGGYAYVIDTQNPQRFVMIAFRPVLNMIVCDDLLLFIGHHAIIAWAASGQAWQSPKLSDEGITINSCADGLLRGRGWKMMADAEFDFVLDLTTGRLA